MINPEVREWFRVHTEFLYTIIYKDGLFYLDFWSLVHLWSGIVLFALLAAFNVKWKWFWFSFLIVIYELIEVAFIYFALNIFRPERLNDQIMDIIVGMFAGGLCYVVLLLKSEEEKIVPLPKWTLKLFSSMTLAFVWAGFYQYKYNYNVFNTQGLNIWSFTLWVLGGFLFLKVYRNIKTKDNNVFRRLALSWLIYFGMLLVIEYFGYYILGIREISVANAKPLIFGLINGNLALRIYYLIFPFLIIPLYEIFVNHATKAQYNLAKSKYRV